MSDCICADVGANEAGGGALSCRNAFSMNASGLLAIGMVVGCVLCPCLGRAYEIEMTDPYYRSLSITYGVPSPSGRLVAIRRYPAAVLYPGAIPYELGIRPANSLNAPLSPVSARMATGLDKDILSWEDDAHLTVASQFEQPPSRTPIKIGAVEVSYVFNDAHEIDDHGPHAETVVLADITYSAQRQKAWSYDGSNVSCILHVQGRDDRFHRWVGFDALRLGLNNHDGIWAGPGAHAVRFTVSYAPGTPGYPTLTQAVLKDLDGAQNPIIGLFGPVQDYSNEVAVGQPSPSPATQAGQKIRGSTQVLFYIFEWETEVKVMKLLREGHFSAALEFGLGKQVVNYSFDVSVPRAIAEQFQTCEAETSVKIERSVGEYLTNSSPP